MNIVYIQNGPAIVTALEEDCRFTEVMENGTTYIGKSNVVAICRCSKSNSFPHCDGSHAKKQEIKDNTSEKI